MVINIKIMGERNSGTNLLRAALLDNFDAYAFHDVNMVTKWQKFVLSRRGMPPALLPIMREYFAELRHRHNLPNAGGWKHAMITPRFVEEFVEPQACQVFCAIRHPVAWARSMHQNPFHSRGRVPKDFDAFLTTPWKLRQRDELGKAPLASPLLLWQKKVQNYVDYAARHPNIHILKYEDLLLDPLKSFEWLAGILGPGKLSPALPAGLMRNFVKKELSMAEYREKAKTTRFANLTETQKTIFDTCLDDGLIQKLGYL